MAKSSTVNEAFKPLYTSDKRYFLLTGGRGSAKSHSVHEFILRLTYQVGHGVLFTRYTMTSAENSIIPDFKDAIARLGLEDDFYITTKDIINLKTKSFVWFRGIRAGSNAQKANLKSLSNISTWVVEEGEDFIDEKTFDKVDDSVRTNSIQNRVIWIMNPTVKDHFIYKRWVERTNKQIDIEGHKITVGTHPDVENIHTTYHVSRSYLSKDWLKKAEKARIEQPEYYAHNYLGGWIERPEGAIYDWSEGEFNKQLPYSWGLDFGYSNDPDALVKIAVDKDNKTIWLKEFMYEKGQSAAVLTARLKEITEPNDLITADSAEPRLIDELLDAGLNIRKAQKGPDSIRSGIKVMQGYRIIIDPDSINLKVEANNYQWNDKRSGKPVDAYNHLLDAARYAVIENETASFFVV